MNKELEQPMWIEIHGEELLKAKKIGKSEFANAMNVKRQNVDAIFKTKNIYTLRQVAEVLQEPLERLISISADNNSNTPEVDGFVEVNGKTYRLKSYQDIIKIIDHIKYLKNNCRIIFYNV